MSLNCQKDFPSPVWIKVLLLVSLSKAASLLHTDEQQTEHNPRATDTKQVGVFTESEQTARDQYNTVASPGGRVVEVRLL